MRCLEAPRCPLGEEVSTQRKPENGKDMSLLLMAMTNVYTGALEHS